MTGSFGLKKRRAGGESVYFYGQVQIQNGGCVHCFTAGAGSSPAASLAGNHPQGAAWRRGSDLIQYTRLQIAKPTVLYFAGWKQHYSLYPAGARLVAEFQNELAPYEISKGTIRFPLAEPVPVKLITRIARFRAKEAAGRIKPAPE